MNKLFIELVPLFVALQAVCYLIWAFNVFNGQIQYPLGDVTSISSMFDINMFSVLVGIGGSVVIGLAMLLMKTGVYAIYAMLLWAIGNIFRVVQTFILAVPNTIGALIPEQINPTPGSTNPIGVVIALLVGYAAFWWLFSLVIQRDT